MILRPSNYVRGFTLLELMASMLVSSVLLGMGALLLRGTGEGYERTGGGIAAEREARAALHQIARDLSSRPDFYEPSVTAGDTRWQLDTLSFITLQPADAQSEAGCLGDMCAVHYYTADLEINRRTVRCLMRGFHESAETFASHRADSLHSRFVPGPRDEPIAFGVVSFIATPLKRIENGTYLAQPATPTAAIPPNFPAPDLPDAISLELVIARREMRSRLRTPANWDGAGNADRTLGSPAAASKNPGLERYSLTLPLR